MEKDVKNRYGSISDVRVDIQKVLADPGGVFAQPILTIEPPGKMRATVPWIAAVILTALIVGIVIWNLRTPEPRSVWRLDYHLPEGLEFNITGPGRLAISTGIA